MENRGVEPENIG